MALTSPELGESGVTSKLPIPETGAGLVRATVQLAGGMPLSTSTLTEQVAVSIPSSTVIRRSVDCTIMLPTESATESQSKRSPAAGVGIPRNGFMLPGPGVHGVNVTPPSVDHSKNASRGSIMR